MLHTYLLFSLSALLTLGAGCGGGGAGGGDGGADLAASAGPDMTTAAPRPDMARGTQAVGTPCQSAAQCSGPNATCIDTIYLPEPSGATQNLTLPQPACSNSGCDINDSTNSCGSSGVCVQSATASQCLATCTQGSCPANEKCLYWPVSSDPSNNKEINACIPSATLVLDCDPTAAPTSQCLQYMMQLTSTLTNGDPNAACVRLGLDNVGACLFLPCQVGPGNCPAGSECVYVNFAQNTGGQPVDKYAGTVCYTIASPVKTAGQACTFLNQCADNYVCYQGLCKQMCYTGTQPSFPNGNPAHKNAATPCPAGTTCHSVFGVAGVNYPGACL